MQLSQFSCRFFQHTGFEIQAYVIRLPQAGGRQPVIKTSVLIPLADNEGAAFSKITWEGLHTRLADFGGFSFTRGVFGFWVDAGKTYEDESRQYSISLDSWTQFPAWLAVMQWARVEFRQLALYIEVAGHPEILR
jgi:hypothetical protein